VSTRRMTALATLAEGGLRSAQRRARVRPFSWPLACLVVDVTMLVVATLTAELAAPRARIPGTPLGWLLALPLLALVLVAVRGAYRPRLRLELLDDLRLLVGATAVATTVVISVRVLIADDPWVAAQSVRQCVFALVYLAAGRAGLSWAQKRAWRRGEAVTPTLIVGAGRVGRLTARRLFTEPELGLRPVGFLDERPLESPTEDDPPLLGASSDLERVVAGHGVRHVILAFSTAPHEVMLGIVQRCEDMGVGVSIVPRLFEKMTDRVSVEHLGGLPLIAVHRADPKSWQFAVKYALDRGIAALVLVIASPFLAGVALAVRLSLGRPVLFKQERIGLDGREFVMLKFRTMAVVPENGSEVNARGAEDQLNGEPLGLSTTPALEDDQPAVGRWLRRTSVDELPQLWNVLRGEMSLVGPRPEQTAYVTLFRRRIGRYWDRHRVKSGLTGWAQVHGLGRGPDRFSATSLADRVEWDNYYIENWSLWLDLKILLLTVRAVFRFREVA
jgi:exopolysaccharide biosynthesis polyprenyl glycosylphosphotransferase